MTFNEFIKQFKSSKCVLKIEDTDQFKQIYKEIIFNGIEFKAKKRSAEDTIHDRYEPYLIARYGIDEARGSGTRLYLLFTNNYADKIVRAEDIVLDNAIANDLMSIINA